MAAKVQQQPIACRLKRALIAELLRLNNLISILWQQEAEALEAGDLAKNVIVAEDLREAQLSRSNALEALKNHISQHEC